VIINCGGASWEPGDRQTWLTKLLTLRLGGSLALPDGTIKLAAPPYRFFVS
jgi:hypothetical protein